MASVPNTRVAPSPVPAGQSPAAAIDPAGFAKQLAEIPEELLKISAAILSGGGGEAPAPDGKADDGSQAETAEPADAPAVDPADPPSDSAQLAAFAPLLQPLPAIVAVLPATPGLAPETQPKIATAAAETAAPTAAMPPALVPIPTGKIKPVKPEAQSDETGSDTNDNKAEAPPALDAAVKEAIAATRRAIDAALRPAGPAIVEAAKIAQPAARPIASALQTVRETRPAAPAVEAAASGSDIATALAMPAAPAPAPAASAQPREAAAPAADRALDLASDSEWLDRLARDIAQAAGNEGTIRFRLHPQTLGHLRVELSQGDHGTSIRLTADTEQARAILADAQPRLVAEARAQGVRIAETHVDLSGSDRHFSGDPRRQDDARQTPLIRTARDAAADADAPDRPGRSRSDRYA